MPLFGCASDEQFMDELAEDIQERYRDSKCDDCNCALRDCSLCGVGQDDMSYLDTAIC